MPFDGAERDWGGSLPGEEPQKPRGPPELTIDYLAMTFWVGYLVFAGCVIGCVVYGAVETVKLLGPL